MWSWRYHLLTFFFGFRVHQLHLQHPSVRKVIKVKGNLKGAQLGSYWSSHSCQNFLYLPMVKMHHQWQCGSKIIRINCLYHKRKDYRRLDITLCLFTLLLSWCTKWFHFSYFGVLMAYGGLQDVRFLNYILLMCLILWIYFIRNANSFQYPSCSFWLKRKIWQLLWSDTGFFHYILWIHAAHIWFQRLIGLLVSLLYAYQRLHAFPVF